MNLTIEKRTFGDHGAHKKYEVRDGGRLLCSAPSHGTALLLAQAIELAEKVAELGHHLRADWGVVRGCKPTSPIFCDCGYNDAVTIVEGLTRARKQEVANG